MKPQPRATGCVNCARLDQWGHHPAIGPGGTIPDSSVFRLALASLVVRLSDNHVDLMSDTKAVVWEVGR